MDRYEEEYGGKEVQIENIRTPFHELHNNKFAGLDVSNDLDESGVLALRLRASLKQVLWEGFQYIMLN